MSITLQHPNISAAVTTRPRLFLPSWELYQAWRAACEEVDLALTDWRCAAVPARADAYAVYRAAADREDAAAEHWLMA